MMLQTELNDDPITERQKKRAKLEERTQDVLEKLGPNGICKPKHVLHFFDNIHYKHVGGQHLSASCMYCGFGPITSTGASRLVHHLSMCSACPSAVRKGVKEMVDTASQKKKLKMATQGAAAEEAARVLQAEKVRNG